MKQNSLWYAPSSHCLKNSTPKLLLLDCDATITLTPKTCRATFRFFSFRSSIVRLRFSLGMNASLTCCSCSSILDSLLVSPIGQTVSRVFIDEFHDIATCHPNR